jgi:hypothetical protein
MASPSDEWHSARFTQCHEEYLRIVDIGVFSASLFIYWRKKMLKKMFVVVAMSAVAVTAFASDYARKEAKQVIDLKDGSTIYLFKDGKMAMESKYGKAIRMKPGVVMETKDGQRIIMVGDEVARLEGLLWKDYQAR